MYLILSIVIYIPAFILTFPCNKMLSRLPAFSCDPRKELLIMERIV